MLEQRHQVDDRLAAAVAPALRHAVNLQPVNAAAVRKTQDVVVRVGNKKLLDKIVFLRGQHHPVLRIERGEF